MKDDALFAAYSIGRHTVRALVLQLKDAAEFEARVAKLLSDPNSIERLLVCWNWPEEKLPCENDKDADCRRCRIKAARLAVEEEMEKWESVKKNTSCSTMTGRK